MTILIENKDGTIAQANVAEGIDEAQHAKLLAKGRNYKIVPLAELPANREFQDAWRLDTTKSKAHVKHDMKHAKKLAHDKRRQERDAAFEPLDRQATVPALLNAIEVKRQVIRDADAIKQAAIDAAKTESSLLAANAL